MIRTRHAGLVLGAAIAIVLSGAVEAGGQTGGRLDLVDQTIFVTDDPVEFLVRVSGGGDETDLAVQVFQAESTRAGLEASFEDLPTTPQIANFRCSQAEEADCEIDDDEGGLATIRIRDDLVGERLRLEPGALPVHVSLLDPDGEVLDTVRTAVVVSDGRAGQDLALAFLGSLHQPVSLQPDQQTVVDVADVRAATDTLAGRAALPVTVDLRPELLTALATEDPATLATVAETLDGRHLFRTPWVALDEEGWRRVDDTERVTAQYALGVDTVETTLGLTPTGVVRLDPDATPETLGLLRTIGATGVVVTDDQLSASSRRATRLQPFQLEDENGLAIPAIRVDEELHDLLGDPDPELAGYRTLAVLALETLDADADLGALLDIDRLDPAALDVLLAGVAARPELATTHVEDLLSLPPSRNPGGERLRGRLDPAPAPDLANLAAELRSAAGSIDALSAMVAPETGPIEGLRTQLLVASSSDLTADEARRYTATVFDEVLDGTTGLSIVPSERITLTDRRADLPLTIINEQTLPLNVELVLTAEKLRFPGGPTRTLRLRPGENDLIIPVETLASGDARITATLTSPGGVFELGRGTVDIRSTAISGLGLLISIVALAVLGAWWVRTILRVRRSRAAATVAAASDDDRSETLGET